MAMAYYESELGKSTQSPELLLKTDLIDRLEVFVYNNLDVIISPNPLLILPAGTSSILEAYINFLPGGFLTKDIQEVFNVFVLNNLNSISRRTRIIGQPPDGQ
jgi:hypothetical protein